MEPYGSTMERHGIALIHHWLESKMRVCIIQNLRKNSVHCVTITVSDYFDAIAHTGAPLGVELLC